MSSPVIILIDRQARKLAASLGATGIIPPLFLYDQPIFRVQIADPPQANFPPNNVYTLADFTGMTMDVALGAMPTGTSGTPTSITRGNIWDANNKWFLCNALDLSQAATLALVTTNFAQVYLEFSIWQAGQPQFRLQLTPNLFAPLDTGSVGNPPPPGPTYPTTQDVRAGFLNKGPTKNDSKIWLSPDGTKAVLQYLGNDGQMKYDPIPAPLPLY